jgi:hypothetical protein
MDMSQSCVNTVGLRCFTVAGQKLRNVRRSIGDSQVRNKRQQVQAQTLYNSLSTEVKGVHIRNKIDHRQVKSLIQFVRSGLDSKAVQVTLGFRRWQGWFPWT